MDESRTAPAAGPPALEVVGVTKRFPGVLALDDVSFALHPGEVHALVGENGAGKSTLIKVLTGVYQPDAGELRHDGQPVRFAGPAAAQAAGISTIYQEVNLISLQSVARNVFLGREPRRFGLIDFARMERDAQRVLADYGVRVDVRRPLRSLGLGMQQMVALARAVSTDARVVVMDEPTSSLEPREVETLFSVIQLLNERGVAVLYVSHKMDELYRICRQVTVMRDGRIVHTGELAGLPRLELVSLMLGRDASTLRNGRTELGGGHARPGRPVLSVRGLRSRHALHGVSFDVAPGEVVGLGGLLGAGRSETAKAVFGALPLDSGEVQVGEKPLRRHTTGAALDAGVALLSEDRKVEGIIPNLSVRENIVLAALPQLSTFGLVSRAKQDRIVETFMQRLRIKASSPDQLVSQLSGGNQQKVLLARWLCTKPKVLLLDEPTRGIDVGAKAEVQALIDELAAEGLGVVLISSELEELLEGSDRIVVLKEGAVVGTIEGEDVTEGRLMQLLATSVADGGVQGGE
ncbi:monosaccharide ABC transporter ATP-binding protein (CUT2 family) [Motilibacter rhizosphaerae]|uniref:Monosaccharide ABC transporter ATP-binding protein (CUT2 family) n=1 Tax=Motilibacter rhizosphaerae TaxID=598652 RepID=A0A4Q7NSW1_9ACTN|nr:sugar ABC transporter ATP-binding protein [Motilibacter rhizosphaerae]RZS89960.1 monosaccharide ABC transporter ATP-binding protein (CUT2 family) [Motilibacter rhizosphaerae]